MDYITREYEESLERRAQEEALWRRRLVEVDPTDDASMEMLGGLVLALFGAVAAAAVVGVAFTLGWL